MDKKYLALSADHTNITAIGFTLANKIITITKIYQSIENKQALYGVIRDYFSHNTIDNTIIGGCVCVVNNILLSKMLRSDFPNLKIINRNDIDRSTLFKVKCKLEDGELDGGDHILQLEYIIESENDSNIVQSHLGKCVGCLTSLKPPTDYGFIGSEN